MNDIYPPHYEKEGFVTCRQCQEAMMQNSETNNETAFIFNVVKYLYRYRTKNGIEDLLKARTYLNLIIKELEDE